MKTEGKGTILATRRRARRPRAARGPLRPERAQGSQEGRRASSDVARGGAEDLRRARRPRRVLPVRLRRPLGPDLRLRPARRCGTSRRSRSSRPTPPPATASTTSRRRCWASLTWGDVHHPALSETNGDYDGRWLFVNDMNGRIARIDLRDFKTKQIFGPVPNVSGNHGSSFVTPNTEYSMMASRFSIPIPKGTAAEVDKYATDYKGVVAGIKIDPKTRRDVARLADPDAALRLRPRRRRQEGLGRLGVLHLATTPSAPPASSRSPSSQRDRDYIAAVDWKAAEKAAAEGKGDMIGGVKVLDPEEGPGPRLPHALRQVARTASTSRPTASTSSAPASCRASRPPSTSRRSRPRSATRTSPATRTASRSSSTSRSRTPRCRSASGRCTRSSAPTATPTPRCSSTARSPSGSSAPGRSSTRSRCPTRSAT